MAGPGAALENNRNFLSQYVKQRLPVSGYLSRGNLPGLARLPAPGFPNLRFLLKKPCCPDERKESGRAERIVRLNLPPAQDLDRSVDRMAGALKSL
jgi:hypothetical protein